MNRFGITALLLLTALTSLPAPLRADGGTFQFRKQAGPFTVTLFSAPVPLRAGTADLSVLVQDQQESALIDAAVTVRLSKENEQDIVARATTAQATNKMLDAAQIELPSAGAWQIEVHVTRGALAGSALGSINVLPEEAPFFTYRFYFAVVPVGIALFVLNQWLKKKNKYNGGLPLA